MKAHCLAFYLLFCTSVLSQAPSTADGSSSNAGCQSSPQSGSQPQPNFFDQGDGGGPGCSGNGWVLETAQQSTGTNSTANNTDDADCLLFVDDNSCDFFVWNTPVPINAAFCVSFTIQMAGPTSDDGGLAFTMFSTGGSGTGFDAVYGNGDDFPCSSQLNGCNSGGGSAVDGNLGYTPVFTDAETGGSGALTVEFDVDDNTSEGIPSDADFSGCASGHISIHEDGCNINYLAGECAPNMNDGNPHQIQICWDPNCGDNGLLTVSMDGVDVTALNEDITSYFLEGWGVSGSTNEVYFAFTGGYQGNFGDNDGSTSYVCDICMSYPSSPVCAVPAVATSALSENCGISLPVELSLFNGILRNRSIDLDWITQSEFQNAYFDIERSYDGSNWQQIHSLLGNGTTNQVSKYNYSDVEFDPTQKLVYYRLKQFDYDGKSANSEIISVKLDALKEELVVYPNPARNHLNIHQEDISSQTLELYNVLGTLILDKNSSYVNYLSNSHLLIDVKDLNSGVYLLKVGDERGVIRID